MDESGQEKYADHHLFFYYWHSDKLTSLKYVKMATLMIASCELRMSLEDLNPLRVVMFYHYVYIEARSLSKASVQMT